MTALEGITVVALEQAVAAPLCTARLAAAGARVIKIERPEGDFARRYDHAIGGESSYFVWLNRGKQSVALDLKSKADAKLLRRILKDADIFLENLAPGAAERLGLGPKQLAADNPQLISCSISGYGQSGPMVKAKAYDLLVQCEAGLAAITGNANAPARVGVSVADICCGMNAHAAILEALIERKATQRGKHISVSLFDGLADWMSVPYAHSAHGGSAPSRVGLHHATIAPYGAYQTKDGKWVVFAVQHEREWQEFCHVVLGDPEIALDPRFASNADRVSNRENLDTIINDVASGLDAETLRTRLAQANIALGNVTEIEDLATHPQMRTSMVEVGGESYSMPAHPWNRYPETIPALNQHGPRIREEFA